MPLKFLISTALLFSFSCHADETKEPELRYILTVGDTEHTIKEGQEIDIKGTFDNPKVTLTASKTRLFKAVGVNFSYPSNFSFEYDDSNPGIKIWTLSGNDSVLMLQDYGKLKLGREAFIQQMISLYGAKNAKAEDISYKFNGLEIKGDRITANIATTSIYQDVFVLPHSTGTRIMIIQDVISRDKVSEEEADLVHNLLNKTLKIEKH